MPVSGLPFSKRTTAAVALFNCIFLASPQGAQSLPTTVAQVSALAFAYGQMVNTYAQLIAQNVSNSYSPIVPSPANQLEQAINQAVTLISGLVSTLNGMSATTPFNRQILFLPSNYQVSDVATLLKHYQIVAQNALTQAQAAQNAPADYE